MFKVVFIVPVSVHGPEFKRSELYVPNIIILAVKFRKILERSTLNKKYMKKSLMQYFFLQR